MMKESTVTAHDQWGYFHEGGITGSQFFKFTLALCLIILFLLMLMKVGI